MAEISKAIKVNNIYTNIIDNITGKSVNYIETLVWHDGSIMDDTKVDGVIYRKKDGKYYVDCSYISGNPINIKRFGAKGDANYFNTSDKKWYNDSLFTVEANDDTSAFKKALSLCPNIQINGNYIISDSITTTIKNQHLFGNGRIVVKTPNNYDAKGIVLNSDGARITGLEILNQNSQGSVMIKANNCVLRDCHFTEVGNMRGYSVWVNNWAENSLIDGCKFIGGDSIWSPQLFIAHSRKTKVVNNYFENAGSWNIHTDHCDEILISGNTCYNDIFDGEIIAEEGQTSFSFTTSKFTFPVTYGFIVRLNGVVISPITKVSTNNNITITIPAATAGDVVRVIAFKGAENLNINSQTFNAIISNNKLYNSGDSNITIASDYKGEILDPSGTTSADFPDNIDILNNYIEGAYGSNIVAGQVVKRVNVIGNHCKNAGSADLPINLAAGISIVPNAYSIIINNTIESSGSLGFNKVGIIAPGSTNKDDMVIKKHIGPNNFIGITEQYSFSTETVGTTLYPGVRLHGDYIEYSDLGDIIENTTWADAQRPNNTPYFTFSTTTSGLTSKESGIIGGGSSIQRSTVSGYTEIVFAKRHLFRKSIMKISFWAKTQSTGSGNLQLIYAFAGYTITSSITINSTTVKKYEAYIPILSPSLLTLRLMNGSAIYNIQDIHISRLIY